MLFDSGASISLITFEKAKELGLSKGEKQGLTVIKVGGAIEEISSCTYILPLVDKRNKVTRINVYGIENISSNTGKIGVSRVLPLFHTSKENISVPSGDVNKTPTTTIFLL